MQFIYRLRNPVQNYAWGSHTVIADLLGRPSPNPQPQAELWIGAHPNGKSIAIAQIGEVPLDKLVSGTGSSLLGRKVARVFKNKLPFLLKVLAAERPLSLQVHPNREQAHKGYKREQALGLEKTAPNRNYKDNNHKPELVCALSPFTVLQGFRPHDEAHAWLSQLRVPSLTPSIEQLERDTETGATGRFFLRLLELEGDARSTVCEEILHAYQARSNSGELEWQWMGRLLERYPEDPGVLAPLLLNLVVLSPGQALFTGAGTLHSYLGGVAVELQANSDNVLRGGLTNKHVDLAELREVMKTEAERPEILEGDSIPPFTTAFETAANEFRLIRLDLDDNDEELVMNPHHGATAQRIVNNKDTEEDNDEDSEQDSVEDDLEAEDWDEDNDEDSDLDDNDASDGEDQDEAGEVAPVEPQMVIQSYFSPEERFVEILFCTEGEVHFETAEKSLTLKQGQAALVAATAPDYRLYGVGQLFIATVPEPKNVPLAPWEIEEQKLLEAQREAQLREESEDSDGEGEPPDLAEEDRGAATADPEGDAGPSSGED